MNQSLKDKTAIITGAGKGIGRAIAIALAGEGVHLGLISRTLEEVEALASQLQQQFGIQAYAAEADISADDEVEEAVAKLTGSLEHIDILINNAGVGKFGKLLEMDPEEWRQIVDINLMGTYNMLRAVLPGMVERNSGDIINIASTAGEKGFATGSAYCASKFAVMGMTESVMQEVRKNNIRVTALTPSTVNTPLAVNAGLSIGDEDRMMQPEDVAEVVLTALRLPARVQLKTAGIWTTNPQ
ncbi:3-oxoacyl-[acyl-carrier protein] reductase [Paenibacillus shirakamiensis]|uniref:3-oxoacyl-[acyl-carrier protein] reductase n=1 Tax=Paenibacillus shirakamiensis TaxID=1265935 RepID=A0ABS4JIF2_9BACL|nr:3-ketoacyl-ACP reductase [Paenibacillus shirakamiensis]MBP2001495.1 3-oxoacyl-[acyl-carrier protein] reductase [Paenibacillus shirakamiensis]